MIGKETGEESFADFLTYQRPPKENHLDKVKRSLNWDRFGRILRCAFKESREGKTSYPPVILFRMLLIQQWYALSDPATEEAVGDRLSFRRFVGLDLVSPVPDETTLCRFRNLLADKGLTKKLMNELSAQLDKKRLLVKRGTLVDASLVEAQAAPPGKDDSQPVDPDAKWTVKNDKPHYGYKLHVGVDEDSGLIRQVEMTSANVHDSQVFDELISGDEQAVLADKAYDKQSRRNTLKHRGVLDGILRKARRNAPLTQWDKTWNRYLGRRRAAVERVFGTLKQNYGFRRVRYLGLFRNASHPFLLVMAFNIKRMTVLEAAA